MSELEVEAVAGVVVDILNAHDSKTYSVLAPAGPLGVQIGASNPSPAALFPLPRLDGLNADSPLVGLAEVHSLPAACHCLNY